MDTPTIVWVVGYLITAVLAIAAGLIARNKTVLMLVHLIILVGVVVVLINLFHP